MKKLIHAGMRFLLIIMMCMMVMLSAVEAASYKKGLYIVMTKTYVYKKKSTKSKKLKTLEINTIVNVTSVSKKYGKVTYGTTKGYVHLPKCKTVKLSKGTYQMLMKTKVYQKASTKAKTRGSYLKGENIFITKIIDKKWGQVTYHNAKSYIPLYNTKKLSNVVKTDYVDWMINFANDDSHGYSQEYRKMKPDVDCSSFVYYALFYNNWLSTKIGTPFRTANMRPILLQYGFQKVEVPEISPKYLKTGDILWKRRNGAGHTEVFVNDYVLVGARGRNPSEFYPTRTADSKKPGDQDGTEVAYSRVESFVDNQAEWMEVYRHPDYVSNYTDLKRPDPFIIPTLPESATESSAEESSSEETRTSEVTTEQETTTSESSTSETATSESSSSTESSIEDSTEQNTEIHSSETPGDEEEEEAPPQGQPDSLTP